MQNHLLLTSVFVLCALTGAAAAADSPALIDNSKVVPVTRFLEDQPLNENAPALRAALMDWEEKSKDVVDVVCPGVFAPLPDDHIKYGSELVVQFIFGSAAYQIANPGEKGKLMPAQLAGMRSMLKAYRSFLARDPSARIPRYDELSKDDEQGTLPKVLEPLVIANCKS
ncbi:hypothetical protein [Dyella sp. 2HG41-7]|uniref:hypothetical protein n=1 Tax=Dyella sp. 2HG41-7 TaxID=2883239 RepID=UPI001F469D3D|nr:hypothetical protein [Dyella sp. 2HG41-7]